MSIIPDFSKGTWKEVKSKKDLNLDYFGFYEIEVIVNEKVISPFLYRPDKKLSIFMPQGKFRTYTTSSELKVALEKFDIKLISVRGSYFIPDKKGKTQFNEIIENMYEQRLNQKDEGQKHVYKLLSIHYTAKPHRLSRFLRLFFSPIVTSCITGICRSMLLEAVADNKDDIIAFATDGIFSTKPLRVPMTAHEKILGEWSFEFHRDFTIFMSGIYSFNYFDHKSKQWNRQTRSRGFKINVLRKMENPIC